MDSDDSEDLADVGEDFLEHLVSSKLTINNMPREEFREHFHEWKLSQPEKYSFSNVKFALVCAGIIKFDPKNDTVHLIGKWNEEYGERKRKSKKKKKKKEKLQQTSSDTSASGVTNEVKPSRRLRPKFLVDQHLSARLPSPAKDVTVDGVQQTSLSVRDTDKKIEAKDQHEEGFSRKKDGLLFCKPCKMAFSNETDAMLHLSSNRHRLAEVMVKSSKSITATLADQNQDIRIGCNAAVNPQNGYYSVGVTPLETTIIDFSLTNISATKTFTLLSWGCPIFTADMEFTQGPHPPLKPGDVLTLQIKSFPKQVGEFISFVFFTLMADDISNNFTVLCSLSISCVDELTSNLSAGRAPKNRFFIQKPKREPPAKKFVTGTAPPRNASDMLEKLLTLNAYDMPRSIQGFINRGFKDPGHSLDEASSIQMEAIKHMLEEGVRYPTYVKRFSTLLYCEEAQMDVDIRNYDMTNVTMSKRGNSGLLVLEVPGLAENRPSVLRGDYLLVRIITDGSLSSTVYQGIVHDVEQTRVVLGFNAKLLNKFIPNMKFSIQFVNNRLPLRVQHRALMLAEEQDMENLLFPSYDTIGTLGFLQDPSTQLTFYCRNPDPNEEQANAIRHIVAGTSRPAPYIVFGPPGTGKTFTIVEAMKQVYKCLPDCHILACAPSNSAADNMAEKLRDHLSVDVLYRLNAASRGKTTIPDKIKDICNLKEGDWEFPTRAQLEKKKIIVCTLITAGRIASANFPLGHFTHIFVDEASQATEPETLVTLANLLDVNKGGQLVLAGDPKQLGPILRSPLARKHELDMSLMERLMTKCKAFMRNPSCRDKEFYDSRVLTKLIRNYRSHPDILDPSNKLFYEGELQACANPLLSERMCGWEALPQKDVPILFHAVIGEDMQEPNSPSFYNPQEISVLMEYVDKLVKKRSPKGPIIKEEHIGIISPYRKQVQKIRVQLTKKGIKDIKVGSTEEFQGQERLIIMVSAVRSQPKFLQTDYKFSLGFLTNPKRFNVAITRAKALLIVIGNPNILSRDESWHHFIQYCLSLKSTRGTELIRMEEDAGFGTLANFLQQLKLYDPEPTAKETSVYNADEQWRRDQ